MQKIVIRTGYEKDIIDCSNGVTARLAHYRQRTKRRVRQRRQDTVVMHQHHGRKESLDRRLGHHLTHLRLMVSHMDEDGARKRP